MAEKLENSSAQLPVTLQTLPFDVKRLIARSVHAGPPSPQHYRYEERYKPGTRTDLLALSLSCRDWAEAAEPLLWERVEVVQSLPPQRLESLLREALPRRAHHVVSLKWEQSALSDVELVLLFARVIPNLARLRHVEASLQEINIRATAGQGPPHGDTSIQAVLVAFVPLALRLASLSLMVDVEEGSGFAAAVDVLEASTRLTYLDLNVSDDADPSHPLYRCLLSSLSRMTRLETLEVWCTLRDYLSEIPTPLPLRRLLLDSSGPRNPHIFLSFISRFSETLTTLELFNMPRREFFSNFTLLPTGTAPFFLPLPHLRTLVYGETHDRTILPYLSSSPLRFLTIEWIAMGAMGEVETFVKEHRGTLKAVKASLPRIGAVDELSGALESQAELASCCRERGIEYEEFKDDFFEEEDEV
ncbi:hypothetical protein JCM8547_001215 [Rhodosporidiobolus lusitaniae]